MKSMKFNQNKSLVNFKTMNADQFNKRMKKIVEYSNKGEMNYVCLRIMLYLTNELDETNKDVLIQSAEAIGANVGGYSYNFIRRGIATLREKNIISEKKSNVDKRYYEYKFKDIDKWKE